MQPFYEILGNANMIAQKKSDYFNIVLQCNTFDCLRKYIHRIT